MKLLIMLFFSANAYSAYDYEYDNNWYVVHKDEKNISRNYYIQSPRYERIPNTDCQLGQVIHKEDPNMNDDIFSRTISCLEMGINENFSCNFDRNWKDEKGATDEYATTCRREFKSITIILKIRRYPNTKYWNKKIMKEAIKAAKIPEIHLNKN